MFLAPKLDTWLIKDVSDFLRKFAWPIVLGLTSKGHGIAATVYEDTAFFVGTYGRQDVSDALTQAVDDMGF